ncbi:hypothetical protein INP83_14805 [Mucilaginibacter sp. 21P]|uniref:hypothetical protein n=1 Tax=Mucilaginibacter sp. 21P TaxID=2778902 RepID=UPI001C5A5018|nr:hypothetical protein [Mucilaginibacter sp. 21P]QXV64352.1 hypothetical protein INP83_14805 [Mucilaginibacter sp. 21P]
MRHTPPPSPRINPQRREAPPSRDYLKDKSVKKKSAKTAAWLIAVAILVFGFLLAKFALSDTGMFKGLPDSDTAYKIARQFIIPTVRSTNARFADDSYKFAKQSDSVYVIKSSYTIKFDSGENQTTHFTIVLKYKGGLGSQIGNWNMISLDQDN